jgi:hypothetical protein
MPPAPPPGPRLCTRQIMLPLAGRLAFLAVSGAPAPTLDQLGSDIIAVRGSGAPCNVSDAVCNSELYRDLPAISNFVGSVGTAQQVIRTHTPFVISSVVVPPLAACGGAGCGALRVDGEVPELQTTQWRAYQAQRSARPTASGVTCTSRVRMAFEQPAVLWELDLNVSRTQPVNISISWGASVSIASQMGWTAALPNSVASGDAVTRGPLVGGLQSVMTARRAGDQVDGSEAGVSLFALLGTAPSVWSFPTAVRVVQQQCNVSGRWRFDNWPASQEMTFVEPSCDKLKGPANCSKGHFTFESANPQTPWRTASGTVSGTTVSIQYNCSVPVQTGTINSACDTIDLGANGRFTREQQQCNVSGRWSFDNWPASQEMTFVEPSCDKLKGPANCSKGHFTFESANPLTPWRTASGTVSGTTVSIQYNCSVPVQTGTINSACDTIDLGANGRFTRGFHPSPPPPPQAIANLSLDASGGGTTLRAVAVFGRNLSHASALLEQLVGGGLTTFTSSWSEAQHGWETRWQNAFSPGSADYSGSLPILTVTNKTDAVAPLERAYYMGVLTLLLVQRNILPMLPGGPHSWPAQPRIYMTGMGNADGSIAIGVSQRWFWDSAQHSLTSSLLDPAMYLADAEQIMASDPHCGNGIDLQWWGRSGGNGIDLHSNYTPESKGYSGCKAQSTNPYVPPRIDGAHMGYVYNPWSYFSTISSVLRVTNDSSFLNTPRETFVSAFPSFHYAPTLGSQDLSAPCTQ